MKTTINARGVIIDDALRTATEKKLSKLEKFFGQDTAMATVTFREVKMVQTVEVTISLFGTIFRAEEEDSSFRNALDRAVETIERQIRKNKTRLEKRLKSEGLAMAFQTGDDDYEYDEEVDFNIRTKTFSSKPMSAEEAILQMNLLGHTFFVFRDDATEQTCVVYKRHDNTYGLLMPEM